MIRRILAAGIVALALGLLACPLGPGAQPAARVPRVGFVSPARPSSLGPAQFRQSLRELSYVEGQNVVIETRYAAGNLDRLPQLAAELVGLKVDVIVAAGNEAIRAAKDATTTIPIVMRYATDDPVASGFVASYARPGGNITGITLLAPEVDAKRMQLIREVVPGLSRIAILVHPARVSFQLKDVRAAAPSLGVQLQIVEARGAGDYAAGFATMIQERANALVVMAHPVFFADQKLLIELAAKHRLPVIYQWRESVDAGGFMSYGPNFVELDRRIAGYVDRILKGAKPAGLPVEGPTAFELVINLRTARSLGLAVPTTLVQRADHVIQ